nr:MAG TPA: Protein of unknown function (DUF1018) [Caudoviricetes sp.]
MKRNYSRFYALLGRMPTTDKDELKVDLVRQYTSNRTESLKEMTDKEYDAMCDGMQQQSNGYKAREIAREELRRKRSAALHLLQKHGIDTTDWNCVNAFCKNPRISGKEFGKLTTEELDLLCIKIRMIQRKGDKNTDYSQLN